MAGDDGNASGERGALFGVAEDEVDRGFAAAGPFVIPEGEGDLGRGDRGRQERGLQNTMHGPYCPVY